MCGKLSPLDIDNRAREVLKLISKVQPLGIPENAEEKTLNTPETAQTLREIAAASIVLLKNERNVLPFNKEKTVSRHRTKNASSRLIRKRLLLLAPTPKWRHTVVVARRRSNPTMPLPLLRASQHKLKTSRTV